MNAAERKILGRWARRHLYVYIRTLSSKLVDPNAKGRLYFVVSVEDGTQQWRGEGYDLSDVLFDLHERVPAGHTSMSKNVPGWLYPKKRKKK